MIGLLRKLRGRNRPRLTGLGLPFLGLQWEIVPGEREEVRKLLIFLEARRVLFAPEEAEIHAHVVHSVLDVREELVRTRQRLREDSAASELVRRMSAECARFLHSQDRPFVPFWLIDLGVMRGAIGVYVAELAALFGLEVPQSLRQIVPPSAEQAGWYQVRTGGELDPSLLQLPRGDSGLRRS